MNSCLRFFLPHAALSPSNIEGVLAFIYEICHNIYKDYGD